MPINFLIRLALAYCECRVNNKTTTFSQVGGRLILEGVLKIYWGLKVPVTLASHNLSYWRRRSQKEQNGYLRMSAAKNKDGIVSMFR